MERSNFGHPFIVLVVSCFILSCCNGSPDAGVAGTPFSIIIPTSSNSSSRTSLEDSALSDLKSAPMLSGKLHPHEYPRAISCKRIMWFTAMSRSGKIALQKQYVMAALMSAKAHAPSLQPHLIYDGQPDNFTRWYISRGGTVHWHNLTFFPSLLHAYKTDPRKKRGWINQYGAYMRLDLPIVLQNYPIAPDIEGQYLLYTDTDVIFARDIDSCTIQPPRFLRIGGESKQGTTTNTGVLYINHTAFTEDYSRIMQFGHETMWRGTLDQSIILKFYRDRLDLLPDRFNWKGYWGANSDAVILHFHGAKPGKCLECLVVHGDAGERSCKTQCPQNYINLFNKAPDGGKLYKKMLLNYYIYLIQGLDTD